jgi:hypothetical protein
MSIYRRGFHTRISVNTDFFVLSPDASLIPRNPVVWNHIPGDKHKSLTELKYPNVSINTYMPLVVALIIWANKLPGLAFHFGVISRKKTKEFPQNVGKICRIMVRRFMLTPTIIFIHSTYKYYMFYMSTTNNKSPYSVSQSGSKTAAYVNGYSKIHILLKLSVWFSLFSPSIAIVI